MLRAPPPRRNPTGIFPSFRWKYDRENSHEQRTGKNREQQRPERGTSSRLAGVYRWDRAMLFQPMVWLRLINAVCTPHTHPIPIRIPMPFPSGQHYSVLGSQKRQNVDQNLVCYKRVCCRGNTSLKPRAQSRRIPPIRLSGIACIQHLDVTNWTVRCGRSLDESNCLTSIPYEVPASLIPFTRSESKAGDEGCKAERFSTPWIWFHHRL